MKSLHTYEAIYGTIENTRWKREVPAARGREEIPQDFMLADSAFRRLVTHEQLAVLETWFPQTVQTLLEVIARSKASTFKVKFKI